MGTVQRTFLPRLKEQGIARWWRDFPQVSELGKAVLHCLSAKEGMGYKDVARTLRVEASTLRRAVTRMQQREPNDAGRTGSRFFDNVLPVDGDNVEAHEAVKAALRKPSMRRDLLFIYEHVPATALPEIRYKKDEILRALRELAIDHELDLESAEWGVFLRSFAEDEEPGMAVKCWHLLTYHPELSKNVAALLRFCRDYEERPFKRQEDTPIEARPDTPPLLPAERSCAIHRAADDLRAGLLSRDHISRRNAASLLSVISSGRDLGNSFQYLAEAVLADHDSRGFARTTVYFVVAMQRLLEAVTSTCSHKYYGSRRSIAQTLDRADVQHACWNVCMWLLAYPKLQNLAFQFLRGASLLTKGCE